MFKTNRSSHFWIVSLLAIITVIAFAIPTAVAASPRFDFIQSAGEFFGMPANSAVALSRYGGNSLPNPTPEAVMGPVAVINVATVAELIAAISTANGSAGADTISQ